LSLSVWLNNPNHTGRQMNSQGFSLKPFQKAETQPNVKITGTVGRSSNTFSISYALWGPLSKLVIPKPSEMLAREDGLWEKTCLEFFLTPKNTDNYWEFNLSPSGDWNVYRFTSYRQGMREEPAFMTLPFRIKSESYALRLSLELGLDEIILADQALEVAVSAVIKSIDGAMSYWALNHPAPQPDFHRRDSFIIRL
jgi:hypothetical protein